MGLLPAKQQAKGYVVRHDNQSSMQRDDTRTAVLEDETRDGSSALWHSTWCHVLRFTARLKNRRIVLATTSTSTGVVSALIGSERTSRQRRSVSNSLGSTSPSPLCSHMGFGQCTRVSTPSARKNSLSSFRR